MWKTGCESLRIAQIPSPIEPKLMRVKLRGKVENMVGKITFVQVCDEGIFRYDESLKPSTAFAPVVHSRPWILPYFMTTASAR